MDADQIESGSQESQSGSQDSESDKYVVVRDHTFLTGARSDSQLLYAERQLFSKNTKIQRGVSYRCNNANCTLRVILVGGVCFSSGASHAHESAQNEYRNLVALNEIKQKVIADKTSSIKDIFHRVLSE